MRYFFALLLTLSSCGAAIVPASRQMTWTPRTNVGVPGGIPTRNTIFVNLLTTGNNTYKCAADGVTDDSAKIQAACAACPSGQVVYAPAGIYYLGATVNVSQAQNYTLRGDGMGLTIFKLGNTATRFTIGTTENTKPTTGFLNITAGATAGSTVITMADTTTVHAGNIITMVMSTPTWMHALQTQTVANVFRITFKVVSKTSTTATITPAIPLDVSGMSPRIIPWGNSGGFSHVTNGVGWENFSIDALLGNGVPVTYQQCWGCWWDGVEISQAGSKQMFLLTVCASEMRRCYHHDAFGSGPNHAGVDFKNDACWNLVEDNISFNAGYGAIFLGDAEGGCVGNVCGYNYLWRDITDAGQMEPTMYDSHGSGGNMFNLWEGNVARGFISDGYFGGSSYGTLLRNYISNKALPQDGGIHNPNAICIALGHYAVYYNIIGNVLGSTEMTSYYDQEQPVIRVLIYRLGYPNAGGYGYANSSQGTEGTPNASYGNYKTVGPTTPPDYTASPDNIVNALALDLNVKNTIIRHGNYDYGTFAFVNFDGSGGASKSPGVVWETNDSRGTGVDFADHTIPNSYYLSGTPSWWTNGLTWPPIDGSTGTRGLIPAEVRYTGGTITPTDPGAAVIQRINGLGKRHRK